MHVISFTITTKARPSPCHCSRNFNLQSVFDVHHLHRTHLLFTLCYLIHYCAVFFCLRHVYPQFAPAQSWYNPSLHVAQPGQINNARFVFLLEYLITRLRLFAHSAPSKTEPDKVTQFLYEVREIQKKIGWEISLGGINFNWKLSYPVSCTAEWSFFTMPASKLGLLNCQVSVSGVKRNFTAITFAYGDNIKI